LPQRGCYGYKLFDPHGSSGTGGQTKRRSAILAASVGSSAMFDQPSDELGAAHR
jgi:hypothetical protein